MYKDNSIINYCCLRIVARCLGCLGGCLERTQEVLNNIWCRFGLYTAAKVVRWPKYLTGKLEHMPTMGYNVPRGRIKVQTYEWPYWPLSLRNTSLRVAMVMPDECISLIVLIVIIFVGPWFVCLYRAIIQCCSQTLIIRANGPLQLQDFTDSGIFEVWKLKVQRLKVQKVK